MFIHMYVGQPQWGSRIWTRECELCQPVGVCASVCFRSQKPALGRAFGARRDSDREGIDSAAGAHAPHAHAPLNTRIPFPFFLRPRAGRTSTAAPRTRTSCTRGTASAATCSGWRASRRSPPPRSARWASSWRRSWKRSWTGSSRRCVNAIRFCAIAPKKNYNKKGGDGQVVDHLLYNPSLGPAVPPRTNPLTRPGLLPFVTFYVCARTHLVSPLAQGRQAGQWRRGGGRRRRSRAPAGRPARGGGRRARLPQQAALLRPHGLLQLPRGRRSDGAPGLGHPVGLARVCHGSQGEGRGPFFWGQGALFLRAGCPSFFFWGRGAPL